MAKTVIVSPASIVAFNGILHSIICIPHHIFVIKKYNFIQDLFNFNSVS